MSLMLLLVTMGILGVTQKLTWWEQREAFVSYTVPPFPVCQVFLIITYFWEMIMHWVQWVLRMSLELCLLLGWTLWAWDGHEIPCDGSWRNYMWEGGVKARDWKDAELQTWMISYFANGCPWMLCTFIISPSPADRHHTWANPEPSTAFFPEVKE